MTAIKTRRTITILLILSLTMIKLIIKLIMIIIIIMLGMIIAKPVSIIITMMIII